MPSILTNDLIINSVRNRDRLLLTRDLDKAGINTRDDISINTRPIAGSSMSFPNPEKKYKRIIPRIETSVRIVIWL
jgi:hypothetical protein